MYNFEYSDYMKKYRKDNNVENNIESVILKNKQQLKNKFPQFIITISSGYGICERSVKAKKLTNGSFEVLGGWGQLAFGVISLAD